MQLSEHHICKTSLPYPLMKIDYFQNKPYNMEISAAWLLTIFLVISLAVITTDASTTFRSTDVDRTNGVNATNVESVKTTPKDDFIDYARPFTNMKDILMQEIQTLNKNVLDKDDAKVNADFFCYSLLRSPITLIL